MDTSDCESKAQRLSCIGSGHTHAYVTRADSMRCNRSTLASPINCDSLPAAFRFDDLSLLLPKVQDLFKDAATILYPGSILYEEPLRKLLGRIVILRSEFLLWATTQPAENKRMVFHRFTQPYHLCFTNAEELTCPVLWADVYSDCM